jgi:hypothetical protein
MHSTVIKNCAMHLKQCHQSGLSIKAYAKQHQLKYDTFLYHYRKHYPTKPKLDLIPVQLKAQPTAAKPLCHIELPSGAVVYVQDAGALGAVLAAVR